MRGQLGAGAYNLMRLVEALWDLIRFFKALRGLTGPYLLPGSLFSSLNDFSCSLFPYGQFG